MKRIILMSCAGLFAGSAVSAYASPALTEGAFMVSPGANYTWYSSKRNLKNAGGFGLEVGYLTNPHFAVQLGVATNKSKQTRTPNDDVRVMQYTLDGNYLFSPFAGGFVPYVGGGVGMQHFEHVYGTDTRTQANLNVDGGIAYLATQNIAVRVGGIYMYTVSNHGRSDFGANAGVVFMFGGSSKSTK